MAETLVSYPAPQSSEYLPAGLATATPTRFDRALVLLLASLLVLLTVVAWPYAGEAGPVLPGIVGAHETAVVVCDLLTAALLFSQFSQYRTVNLLILACGYLFTAAIVTIHLGSFPGVFTTNGIVGGDTNTPSWLWNFWHVMFPLAAWLYSSVHGPIAANPAPAIAVGAIISGATVAAAYGFSTHNDALPPLIANRDFTPFYLEAVFPLMMGVCLATLAALLRARGQPRVITLYLALAVLAFFLDLLNHWHSGARFAVGWYLGRANSLIASVLLCVVFIMENARLLRYANRAATQLTTFNSALNAASAAKSRFFAAASHDLRQPFQAMRLFFEVLEGGAHNHQREVLTRLDQAMASAETLLDELLDVARMENGQVIPRLQQVDLGELLVAMKAELSPVAMARGLVLRVYQTPTLVCTDPILLRRLLFNLVANSIRYTQNGGILVGLRRRQGKVLVEVWDTGIGIAEEQAERIFEEFYQVENASRDRTQGLGLGLAIVKRLGDSLGCEVTLASQLGRGTVFRVGIPV